MAGGIPEYKQDLNANTLQGYGRSSERHYAVLDLFSSTHVCHDSFIKKYYGAPMALFFQKEADII